ncbi:MAG TPA: hypothetical protein VFY37_06070, partial [Solirubrobacterales bacterium]|nr:hypothetical protein [Solirubrobacterales bacterium]
LRQLIVIRTVGEPPDAFTLTAAEPERLRAQAEAMSDLTLGRAVDTLSKALADIREGDEPRMTVELALLRAARPQLDPSKEALAERLERLEAAVAGAGGGIAVSDPAPDETVARQPEPAGRSPRMSSPATPPPAPEPGPTGSEPPPVAESSAAEEANDGRPPTAAVVVEAVSLERVVRVWPEVIDQVREGGAELLSHVLAVARPVAVNVEEAVLEVGFPPSAAFNKRKAEAAEARDRIADAVKRIVGERLRPVYVLLEGDEIETPAEAKLSEEELIELVRSEFDAEEYVAEPEDGEAEAKEMNG